MSRTILAFYCLCGGAMTGFVEPADKKLESIFRAVHSGDGHGLATKREAANARRRKDREYLRSAP